MTLVGYPGLERFYLPAAGLTCVLAGASVVRIAQFVSAWLSARVRGRSAPRCVTAGVVAVLVILSIPLSTSRINEARAQEPIAAAGGHAPGPADRPRSRRSAATTGVYPCKSASPRSTTASRPRWPGSSHVTLGRVGTSMRHSGVMFVGPHDSIDGGPPRIDPRLTQQKLIAHVDEWKVYQQTAPVTPPASGLAEPGRPAIARLHTGGGCETAVFHDFHVPRRYRRLGLRSDRRQSRGGVRRARRMVSGWSSSESIPAPLDGLRRRALRRLAPARDRGRRDPDFAPASRSSAGWPISTPASGSCSTHTAPTRWRSRSCTSAPTSAPRSRSARPAAWCCWPPGSAASRRAPTRPSRSRARCAATAAPARTRSAGWSPGCSGCPPRRHPITPPTRSRSRSAT